ncbi:BC1872 family protein [Paenibacillus alvei]|uniref:Phage ABA sandwich domain-containing protein n=1 Tax=Paenibacillus alvei TaxID=44250 RepID=A0A383RFW6_PAEAL|nr:hypothetical protein [Paenibacillus alvei]SYX85918.1 conserved protein of unknown function [Paenibacillus alvei]
MTREQILSMTPGRELDAIVCELIYGWRRIKGPKTDYEGPCEYGDVLIPPTILSEDEAYRMMKPKGAIPFGYFVNRRYSEDISAAWELVEKLSRGRVDNSFVLDFHFERYYATFGEVPIRPCRAVMYKTAPEAITKAAILAMMESGGTRE